MATAVSASSLDTTARLRYGACAGRTDRQRQSRKPCGWLRSGISAAAATVADSDGRFTFESASGGNYTLAISSGAYSPVTATTMVRPGQTVDFGNIALLRGVIPTTAVLRGRVTDNISGAAIADALVEVAGPGLSTLTDAGGNYQIAGIPAGGATITVTRVGYAAVQGGVNFVAGQVYNFSPQLTTVASTLVTVEGVATDVQTSTPLSGVLVTATVNGDASTATTDAAGGYRIESLPVGALSVTATRDGYYSVAGTTTSVPGSRIVFSPSMTPVSLPQPPPPPAGQVTGVLVDSISGLQVSGATVQFVVGSTVRGSASTDADGRFSIGNVVGSGELRASRTNYRALAIPLTIAAGTIVDMGSIDFVPTLLNNGGAFRGTVYDALTNAPRSGVTVTAVFGTTTRTASTSASGQFQFTGINPLEGTVRLTRAGYETLDIGVSLNLGEMIDLGSIYVRPVDTDDVNGDLTVQTVDARGVTVEAMTFAADGAVNVGIQNSGNAPLAGSINVKAFSDADRNGAFDIATDVDLGNSYLAIDLAPGAVATTSIPLYGALPFRDAPITLWLDSDNALIEQSETNNTDTTAGVCTNSQRLAVDLGLCLDSSGSMSAAEFQLQLNGTAAAVENPAILPRDGSVRVTVMQFDSATRVEVAGVTAVVAAPWVAALVGVVSVLISVINFLTLSNDLSLEFSMSRILGTISGAALAIILGQYVLITFSPLFVLGFLFLLVMTLKMFIVEIYTTFAGTSLGHRYHLWMVKQNEAPDRQRSQGIRSCRQVDDHRGRPYRGPGHWGLSV